MLCYKDTTFCSSKVKNHTCNREITEKEEKAAQEMGLPVAYAEFCEDNNVPNTLGTRK